jgi:hypothetical protein
LADRIVVWRFKDVTYGLTRVEAEFLRDRLFADRRVDWARLGVMLRKALNGSESDLPIEFSVFDGPALRAVLDGVLIGRSSGLAALQRDVGATPHPDEAPPEPVAQSGRVEQALSCESHEAGAEHAGDVSTDPVVVWRFDGVTQGLNRAEAEVLRDRLLAEPNLAWLALGGRLRDALSGADGRAPAELTLADVPVLRAALDAASLGDDSGLALLKRSADLVWGSSDKPSAKELRTWD